MENNSAIPSAFPQNDAYLRFIRAGLSDSVMTQHPVDNLISFIQVRKGTTNWHKDRDTKKFFFVQEGENFHEVDPTTSISGRWYPCYESRRKCRVCSVEHRFRVFQPWDETRVMEGKVVFFARGTRTDEELYEGKVLKIVKG